MDATRSDLVECIVHTERIVDVLSAKREQLSDASAAAYRDHLTLLIEYNQQRLQWLMKELSNAPKTQVFFRYG